MTTPVAFDNTTQSFNLEDIKRFAEANDNTKILVNDNNDVQFKGAVTSRLPGTMAARLRAANAFYNTLVNEYGKSMADYLKQDAQFSSVFNGKPLSSRRVKAVIDMAESKVRAINNMVANLEFLESQPLAKVDPDAVNAYRNKLNELSEMRQDVTALLDRRTALPVADYDKTGCGLNTLPSKQQTVFKDSVRSMLEKTGVELDSGQFDSLASSFYNTIKFSIARLNQPTLTAKGLGEFALEHQKQFNSELLALELSGSFKNLTHYLPISSCLATLSKADSNYDKQLANANTPEAFQTLRESTETKLGEYQQTFQAVTDQFKEQWSESFHAFCEKNGLDENLSQTRIDQGDKYILFKNEAIHDIAGKQIRGKIPSTETSLSNIQQKIGDFFNRLQTEFDVINGLNLTQAQKESLYDDAFGAMTLKGEMTKMVSTLASHPDLNPNSEKAPEIESKIQTIFQSQTPSKMLELVTELESLCEDAIRASYAATEPGFVTSGEIGAYEVKLISEVLGDKFANLMKTNHFEGLTLTQSNALVNMLSSCENNTTQRCFSIQALQRVVLENQTTCVPLDDKNITQGIQQEINKRLTQPLSDEEANRLSFSHLKANATHVLHDVDGNKLTAKEAQEKLQKLQEDFIGQKTAILNCLSEYSGVPEAVGNGVRELLLLSSKLTPNQFDAINTFMGEFDAERLTKDIRKAAKSPEKLMEVINRFSEQFSLQLGASIANAGEIDSEDQYTSLQIGFLWLAGANEDLRDALATVSEDVWEQSFLKNSDAQSKAMINENINSMRQLGLANTILTAIRTYLTT